MHGNTRVDITDKINIIFSVNEKDKVQYSSFLIREHAQLLEKNSDVTEILSWNNMPVSFNNSNDCVAENDFALSFPNYIVDYFKVKYMKSIDSEYLLKLIRHEITQLCFSAGSIIFSIREKHACNNNENDIAPIISDLEEIESSIGNIRMIADNSVWELAVNNDFVPSIEKIDLLSLYSKMKVYFKSFADYNLKLVISSEEDCSVFGDSYLVEQALHRMIMTSIRFAYQGTNIYIICSNNRITVKSYGQHITPETSDRLFLPEGILLHGTSLNMVQNIAKRHSGAVSFVCGDKLSLYNVALIKLSIEILYKKEDITSDEAVLLNDLYQEDERLELQRKYDEITIKHSDRNQRLLPNSMILDRVRRDTYENEIVFEIKKDIDARRM